MEFNRRSFITSLLAAYGAAKVPSPNKPKAKPQGDEVWWCVSFEDGDPKALASAVAKLKHELNAADLTRFKFVNMPLPDSVDYARTEMLCGVPMRHIRVYDPVRSKLMNRIDVCARRAA